MKQGTAVISAFASDAGWSALHNTLFGLGRTFSAKLLCYNFTDYLSSIIKEFRYPIIKKG